jgi:hypothetical protein
MKKKSSLLWEDIVLENKFSKAKRPSIKKIKDAYLNGDRFDKNIPLDEMEGNKESATNIIKN